MSSTASTSAPRSPIDRLAACMEKLAAERPRVPQHDRMVLLFLDVTIAVVERFKATEASYQRPRGPFTRSASAAAASAARAAPSSHTHGHRRPGGSFGKRRGSSDSNDGSVDSPMATALALLLATVDAFFAFRVTFSKTTVTVFRIAFIRRMFECLDALLGDLDRVVELADLQSKTEAGDLAVLGYQAWRVKLVDARDKEEAELSVVAKRSTMPFARNIKGHEAMEALTLMKFEIDFYPPPRNSKTHVASMKAVFFSIVRSSNGRVTKIPNWYSPPYLIVSEDTKQLRSTGLGTANRARWADRHHDGAVVDVVAKWIELDSEGIDAFRREVEIWYAIDCPHVVKLLSASHCSSPTLLVLEDAKHDTLREYVKRDGGHRRELFTKALEAALGLQFMREQHQIVHGNLKPSNILIGADGKAKVTDFGGGMVTLQNLKIQHKNRLDLMKWRAPEFQSYRKRPSYQADVFSLALCIVDAIVDNFVVPTVDELARKGLRVQGLSADAQALIDGMVASNPDVRTPLNDVIRKLSELARSPSPHFDLSDRELRRLESRSNSGGICDKHRRRLPFRMCRSVDVDIDESDAQGLHLS